MEELVKKTAEEIVLPNSAKFLKWGLGGIAGLVASGLADLLFDKGYARHIAKKALRK